MRLRDTSLGLQVAQNELSAVTARANDTSPISPLPTLLVGTQHTGTRCDMICKKDVSTYQECRRLSMPNIPWHTWILCFYLSFNSESWELDHVEFNLSICIFFYKIQMIHWSPYPRRGMLGNPCELYICPRQGTSVIANQKLDIWIGTAGLLTIYCYLDAFWLVDFIISSII